ncbi:aminotransferase, DegT/DnrJ/EryC1/StrS family [Campylobacter sp. RM5004]|uniref:DegT/DnrJ/EryC1/StrS family aminotransferase n=1 Tax=Campylobacter sp. RM5004 TaxID=1660078 RepID=UPI001EFBD4DF|nr:DegT/DnrJ/EryC1/StrS aminotransferase family protein [Campylobacter sp. RM5004]ULO01278.1 aminotransferase, DegT/DnrJ/EryC1/StrS family [Campylobacter sp. RM5004]
MKEISCFLNVITEDDKEFLIKSLDDDINTIQMLEDNLKEIYKGSHIVLTNNHTAAHHLALSAIDLKRGDKVICSVNSFPTIAQSIRYFDAEPIFVDVELDSFNIDIASLEQALIKHNHKKLRAVFVNHTAGLAAKLDEIRELCNKFNVAVINDCGFALGMEYKGELVGGKDLISSFGFNAMRKDPVFAGGFLVINDDKVYERAKLLNSNGISSNAWGNDGNLGYFYDVTDIGHEYEITKVCASLALSKVKNYKYYLKRRREIAKIYDEELKNLKHIKLPAIDKEHTFLRYIIKVDKNRDNFARKLKEMGINTGIHFIPLNFLTYYKQKYNLKINDFPNALANYAQILSIPIHINLSDEDVKRVCDAIKTLDSSWI